ncbi:MAG: gliding motility protein GldL [Chitinophagales bacterium]|nr:MAG: gliding motility protein GldL [Chitinophagales bacterium]
MAVKQDKRKASGYKLDPLNMAYGIGAAVVIFGLLAKFLHWRYANEFLFIGLATEALVFFISAFEPRKVEKDYKWEKLFPQLVKEEESPIERLEQLVEQANLDPVVIEKLTHSIELLEQNITKMTEVSNMAQFAEHIERMKQASETFEDEVIRLNKSIAEMNAYYEKMLEVFGHNSKK